MKFHNTLVKKAYLKSRLGTLKQKTYLKDMECIPYMKLVLSYFSSSEGAVDKNNVK